MEKYSEIEKHTKENYIKQHRNYDIDVSVFRIDNPIAKLFYGNGHVKLVAEKP